MKSLSLAIAVAAMLAVTTTPASAVESAVKNAISNPTTVWSAWGGSAEFRIHRSIPQDLELTINTGTLQRQGNVVQIKGLNLGSLEFAAPQGQFENFLSGSLAFDAPMHLSRHGVELSFKRLFVEPRQGGRHPMLQLRDDQGRVLFYTRQIHVYTVAQEQRLVIERMDVHMTEELAQLLGEPLLANQFLGELELNANLNIPAGAQTEVLGTSCADRPKWPTAGFDADVGLIDMGFIQDTGQVSAPEGVYEIATPSSSLKSLVGLDGADVAWQRKFTGVFPPYNNDQHPYLVWNMYRTVDNRLEQIGVSGIKHAFLTINVNCTLNCGDNHVLWPGCEDVYGIGNNDNPGDVGPRDEVNPRTGVFQSQGSFFDRNGDGVQDNSSDGNGENRLLVLRSDLTTPGANYLFESWYVVRDDVNIFNGMGYHPFNPVNTSGNNWAYQLSPFQVGPAVDSYVAPGTDPNTGSHNVVFEDLNNGIGHVKVAVRTEDLGNGDFRYNYFVMNYDVEHGLDGVAFPELSAVISDVVFHDPDQNAANDWTNASDASGFHFDVVGSNNIAWGTGYTFSFIASGANPEVRPMTISLGNGAPQATITIDVLGPGQPDQLLEDGFEG